ncbi:hypothetical protein FOL47_010251 [Perkinsus chesapeaki]|uniref:PH domain-containing protein n=1 Tax=Perkinsus chesapeaki TaxID=330153 RepID=A0A7J6MPY3_PERCH|nr:hypothetical protein FOL47_010251 [Perkinsus chesapeaki]
MEVEQYHVAQLYMVAKSSLEDTTGGAGVEVVTNEPYDDGETQGQFTHKRISIAPYLPSWVTSLVNPDWLVFDEKSWNAFPRCRTVYSCPMLSEFSMEIDSMHIEGNCTDDNALKLDDADLAKRKIDFIDIVNDHISSRDYNEEEDPSKWHSEKLDMGPLESDWMQTTQPIMTCYKVIHVTCNPGFMMQNRVESFIVKATKTTLFKYHRKCVCWADEWADLTMDDIRLMEDKVQKKLRKFWRDKRIEEGLEVASDSDASEVQGELEGTPTADEDASPGSATGRRSRTASRASSKDTTGLLTVTASPVDPARTSVSASVNNDIAASGRVGASHKCSSITGGGSGVEVMRAGSLFKLGDGIINTSWNERYFVLSGSVLSYYRDSREVRPRESIPMKGAVVQWCGSHKGREHAFIVEAADRATASTTPGPTMEASPKVAMVAEGEPKGGEGKVEARSSGGGVVREKSVDKAGPSVSSSSGGLLPDACTRYLPKDPLRGMESLLRFARCGYQRNDMCMVSTDRGLRIWRQMDPVDEEAGLTVFLSKVWSEATRVDFYSVPLSIAFAITTLSVFVILTLGALLTPLAAFILVVWSKCLLEVFPIAEAVREGTSSGVVIGEVVVPTTDSSMVEAALLDVSEWHRWSPALKSAAAYRLSTTGLGLVKYGGAELTERIIRPREEGPPSVGPCQEQQACLPSLIVLHYDSKANEKYFCWAVFPGPKSVSVLMLSAGGPGRAIRGLRFVREYLSSLQVAPVVWPRPLPSLPDMFMPRGSQHVHARRRGSGGWVELPVPYGVKGLDSALKRALLHNSEEAIVGGRVMADEDDRGGADVMPTLMALSHLFIQSSAYMPRASTAIVNNDSCRALQLVGACIVASLQRLLCALESSDAFLTTSAAAARTPGYRAIITPGDTCQCKTIPRAGRGHGADICWEAVAPDCAHYLVTEEEGCGRWTQRGTIKFGVSLLPPTLKYRTTGIALNLTGKHYIDFLSSEVKNAAERSSKRTANKGITAFVTELPRLVCRPLSGSSKHCLLRWEGKVSINIPGANGGICELSIVDPSSGRVAGEVRNGRGGLHSVGEGNIFDRVCFDGEPLWVSGLCPEDLAASSEHAAEAFPPTSPVVEIKVESSKRLLPTDCHTHRLIGRRRRVQSTKPLQE